MTTKVLSRAARREVDDDRAGFATTTKVPGGAYGGRLARDAIFGRPLRSATFLSFA